LISLERHSCLSAASNIAEEHLLMNVCVCDVCGRGLSSYTT
jgi:hypothetical protein